MKFEQYGFGLDKPPFIIAEMSGNHNQSLERAKEIVKAASESGVQAIKLQTYTAETITIDHAGGLFEIDDKSSLWAGKNLFQLYKEAYTPWEWHKPLFDYARSLGLLAFSSPFDETAVDFLETLDVPFYKVASFENNHHPMLKKIAKTGKPVIMSTGISTVLDIIESVNVLRDNGCSQIILLKCTSTYPASPITTNLATIPVFREIFPDCLIGLSDHTMGIGVSVASVALGAAVIEKHFTIRRSDGGVDSNFSMEPAEMKLLVSETKRAWESLGVVQLSIQKAEEKSLNFKRSIYVTMDLQAGDVLSAENIRVIRPGNGLHPRHFESMLGKKVNQTIKRGTPFSASFVG